MTVMGAIDPQRLRQLIAAGVRDTGDDDDEMPVLRVRAPGSEPGRPKRGQPGWTDPDVKRRGTDPPSGGGVRSDPF